MAGSRPPLTSTSFGSVILMPNRPEDFASKYSSDVSYTKLLSTLADAVLDLPGKVSRQAWNEFVERSSTYATSATTGTKTSSTSDTSSFGKKGEDAQDQAAPSTYFKQQITNAIEKDPGLKRRAQHWTPHHGIHGLIDDILYAAVDRATSVRLAKNIG